MRFVCDAVQMQAQPLPHFNEILKNPAALTSTCAQVAAAAGGGVRKCKTVKGTQAHGEKKLLLLLLMH